MNVRMVRAELLKLAKRRGVVIAAVTLTLGIALIVMVVPEIYYLAHKATADPAGGEHGLVRGASGIAFLGAVAGLIVGSAAGTGDLSSGIFRDLVATGRSRWGLFAARVPGAFAFFLPVVTLAFVVMALLDLWFSSGVHLHVFSCHVSEGGGPVSGPTSTSSPGGPAGATGVTGGLPAGCVELTNGAPAASQFFQWYGWVLLVTCFDLVLALGLSSLLGSRSLTLGILLPFQLIVAPLLAQVSALGGWRQILFPQSFTRLAPPNGSAEGPIHMFGNAVTSSVAMSWGVLAVWVVAMLAVGAWRTATRDA